MQNRELITLFDSMNSMSLEFGEKVKRKKKLTNSTISEIAKIYEGEISIYSVCTWRLTMKDSVICSAHDSNEVGGRMAEGLKQLVNQTIIDIQLVSPVLDLNLFFTNGYKLSFFCDEVEEDGDEFDYCVFTRHKVFTFGTGGKLLIEKLSID